MRLARFWMNTFFRQYNKRWISLDWYFRDIQYLWHLLLIYINVCDFNFAWNFCQYSRELCLSFAVTRRVIVVTNRLYRWIHQLYVTARHITEECALRNVETGVTPSWPPRSSIIVHMFVPERRMLNRARVCFLERIEGNAEEATYTQFRDHISYRALYARCEMLARTCHYRVLADRYFLSLSFSVYISGNSRTQEKYRKKATNVPSSKKQPDAAANIWRTCKVCIRRNSSDELTMARISYFKSERAPAVHPHVRNCEIFHTRFFTAEISAVFATRQYKIHRYL